jgi:DnaJ homolog subfamily C member 13
MKYRLLIYTVVFYCLCLGLDIKETGEKSSTTGQPNESVIRKAYFRLANKFHPDKNPDGRDMFERVNKAYEFLCAASRIQQGPNEFNIYLLLKAQAILYRRHKTLLAEYKYAGYPLLIRILETEAKNDLLFSMGNTTKATALLPIAIELLYYTLDCSELNCEELRRENGLEILTQVFQRCSSVITKSSKADDFVVAVCQYSALCYGVAGHFEKSRDLFVDPDKLQCVLRDLCHCLNYTHLKQLCTCVCQAAMSLCSVDARLRDLLYRCGLFVYICRGLFNYDYTLDVRSCYLFSFPIFIVHLFRKVALPMHRTNNTPTINWHTIICKLWPVSCQTIRQH